MSDEEEETGEETEIAFETYEPQQVGIGDGELVILDVVEFSVSLNCMAISWAGGTLFVLDRDTKEWRVVAPYSEKKTKNTTKVGLVKPLNPQAE